MDPKTCLTNADQSISDCDFQTARECLTAYRAWRARGGFEPVEVAGTHKRGDTFAAWCEGRLASALRQEAPAVVRCDMCATCTAPVTHLDSAGFVYCTAHGVARRNFRPCRKLRAHELRKLTRGETIARY